MLLWWKNGSYIVLFINKTFSPRCKNHTLLINTSNNRSQKWLVKIRNVAKREMIISRDRKITFFLIYTCTPFSSFVTMITLADYSISRNDLFLVQNVNGEYNCTTLIKTIIAKLFLKYIWDSRNRFSLPNIREAKETITSDLLTLVNSGNSIRRNFNDSGLAQKFLQGWI